MACTATGLLGTQTRVTRSSPARSRLRNAGSPSLMMQSWWRLAGPCGTPKHALSGWPSSQAEGVASRPALTRCGEVVSVLGPRATRASKAGARQVRVLRRSAELGPYDGVPQNVFKAWCPQLAQGTWFFKLRSRELVILTASGLGQRWA